MINELENMTNEYNLPVCVDSSAQKASGGEGGRDKTVHRGSVGGGTQEGHTEPPRSTWIGKETLAKCLCGDGHEGNKGVPWDGASQGLCWAETNCTSSTRDP